MENLETKSDQSALLSPKNLTRLVIAAGGIFVLLLIFLEVIPFTLRIIYADTLPAKPDYSGSPVLVKEYLDNAYSNAERKPYSDEEVAKLAMAYHANFFYDAAEKCYNAAIKLNEEEWLYYYYMALIKEELGDAAAAADYLKKVTELNPQVTHAWYRLGNSYFKLNKYDEAESAFIKVNNAKVFVFDTNIPDKGAFPLSAYSRLNLGRIYFRQDNIDGAVSTLSDLVDQYPIFGPAYRLLGRIFTETGNPERGKKFETRAGDFDSFIPPADPIFNELILYSRDSGFLLKLVDIARRNENFVWGEIICLYILDYDPSDVEALTKYIQVILETHQYEKLEAQVNKYYELNKDNDEDLKNLARTFYMWGGHDYASKLLERAIEVNPNAVEAHVLYLKVLVSKREDDAALQHCEKALALNENNADLLSEYGRILYLNGKEKEARRQFDLALAADPSNEVTLILMGVMAQAQGSKREAINYYRKSIKVNPINVNTIVTLCNYLLSLKRWNEALQLIENALEDSPNNVELLERYATILAACPVPSLRDEDRALELATRIAYIRKTSPDQEIRCAITLSIAYAGVENYEAAVSVMNNVSNRSKQVRVNTYDPKIERLTKQFQEKKPYRL